MSHSITRYHFRTAGLSLIELMIAMVIGVLLLLGLVQTMSASRAAYQLSAGVARTQENARFAMDYLQRDLRMAGHLGCVNDQSRMQQNAEGVNLLFMTDAQRLAENYQAAPFAGRFDMGIQGFEANGTAPNTSVTLPAGDPVVAPGGANDWSPSLPQNLFNAIQPVAGSDIITMRYFSPVGAAIASFTATGTNTSVVVPEPLLKAVTTEDTAPGIFGLSDCTNASIFAGTVNTGDGAVTVLSGAGSVNQSNFDGSAIYEPAQAVLYRAESVVYYVGVGAGEDQPSLFRARYESAGGAFNVVTEELVEGVESLQLLYGSDNETDLAERPTGYISRTDVASAIGGGATNPNNAQAGAWRRVGAVQIGLLMRSSERAAATQADKALSVLDVRMTPASSDGYYRSVYENTVALRNRLFGN
ncbi:MAG: PilW family protein [Lysobacter sp.]